MKEPARLARNAQRLSELHLVFAQRIAAVIAELESAGYRPRIQDAWRSPQSQLEAFERGTSKLKFGFHNVTGPAGQPEALAVDMLDDDFPLNPRLDYLLRLAGAARKQLCETGIAWGLPNHLREAIAAAIDAQDWNARLKIGWDPTHIEPSDLTVAAALAGARPTVTPVVAAGAVRRAKRRSAKRASPKRASPKRASAKRASPKRKKGKKPTNKAGRQLRGKGSGTQPRKAAAKRSRKAAAKPSSKRPGKRSRKAAGTRQR